MFKIGSHKGVTVETITKEEYYTRMPRWKRFLVTAGLVLGLGLLAVGWGSWRYCHWFALDSSF